MSKNPILFIRQIEVGDAARVAEIHSASIRQVAGTYPAYIQEVIDIWGGVSAEGHIRSLAIEDKFVGLVMGEIVVAGSTLKDPVLKEKVSGYIYKPDTYELAFLYADPSVVGKGYGKIMLDFLVEHLM